MVETDTTELDEFVSHEVQSGKYRSRDEVIAAGLRLLLDRERKLEWLRSEIQIGIDELDRGEGIELKDDAALRAYFDDIKARGRERLAARNAPS